MTEPTAQPWLRRPAFDPLHLADDVDWQDAQDAADRAFLAGKPEPPSPLVTVSRARFERMRLALIAATAKGDGVTDDSAAVRAMANGGGYLRPGDLDPLP